MTGNFQLLGTLLALAAVSPIHSQHRLVAGENERAIPASTEIRADFSALLETERYQVLSEDQIAEGWLDLFDGSSLHGWRNEGDADFQVVDGKIIVQRGSRACLLRTTSQFDNYRLRVRFLSDRGTNSGIFLRTSPAPTNPSVDCYELNIAELGSNPFPTGSLVGRDLAEGAAEGPDRELRWQTFEVMVNGPSIRVELDGERVLDYTDREPLGRGFVGLQYREGSIAFASVQLLPLGLTSILPDRDLAGWESPPDQTAEFSVENEQLSIRGGPGRLESQSVYQDFVVRLTCRTNDIDLNSGVFFRCVPGENLNGYESQIHNGFESGDRRKPTDCGTGGIFRRRPARYVNADDAEWFTKTIVVCGPHISVWVNGMHVTDWSDHRRPDPNPRRGQRLEAGSLMLQAHDETTDLTIKAIDVRELNPRNRR